MNDEKRVLVVGGGIGGITAALELASCGVRVTMLEEGPSIGGRMIQLDKTFPTLDCSTCTLSPKMVEVALQKRIELLSWAMPRAVKKEEKGFLVTIHKKARFVDTTKCNACGSCSVFCPVVMKSEFNMGTGSRKAVYIPFPQAIPNKASIDKREDRPCKAACVDACPVHTNVLGYVKHIREGRFNDAYLLIRETNPFPSACGRVCYAPCEKACNRGQLDHPVAIRDLKRFAVDQFDPANLTIPQVQRTEKKIAVVGAGPAGLACAHDLALNGHDVTVYEALPEPGGMMRYAIPEYRLPRKELDREIDYIERLGVTIACGVRIGEEITLAGLRERFDAVFIAAGAPVGLLPGIEGENLLGVIDGLRFLRSARSSEVLAPGKVTAVIGGGNTAVDCGRTAKRLGSESVIVIYRRTRDEMPAAEEEIEAMLHEGIAIEFLAAPVRFRKEGNRLAIECIRMKLGDPDQSGRRRPQPMEGSEFTLSVDAVITALGQAVETSFASGLARSRSGTIIADPTGATSLEDVFAGGDVTTGPAYVVDAIAAGKKAARSIGKFLKGEEIISEPEPEPQALPDDELSALSQRFAREERLAMPELPVPERTAGFAEVTLGFSPGEAISEASRCLAGAIDGCIECGECAKRCDVHAIDYAMKDEVVEQYFDSIVLAPGFDLYDPTEKGEYGYGTLPGVVTGIEFERICSVTGPTGGDILIQGKTPKRFFFIQCVGSRDRQSGARFCSRVCCMYTAKHASIVKDRIPDAEVYVSYIDVRAYGKNYEEFYKSTQESGASYIRGIPGEISKTAEGLLVRVEDMLSGELREIEVDVVVLATGVRPRKETEKLLDIMSVEKDEYGFVKVTSIHPSRTNVKGIFACGMASGPKDVPDTVASGGEAAARCMEYIHEERVFGN
ncbi:MAG TPA: FAD-dependent oxidoreductase [Syntrophorhabdaceae bacterium]|jgi:heterodisulfide reductase subunit A